MRVALLSDIHGNSIALDAVLCDIEQSGGVDEYWALGDLVALGPDPVGVVERLDALPTVSVLRGNTDRYVATGERPAPSVAEAIADPSLVSVIAEVAGSFGWTAGYMQAAGLSGWLEALPLQLRRTLPDGTPPRLRCTPHRSPTTGRASIHATDAAQAALLAGCGADIVFAGHTHRPVDRQVGPIRAVNLGSVSNPIAPDLRASYVILDADTGGYRVEHRRVDYDRAAVISAVEQLNHPGRGYVIRHHRGEMR